MRGAAKGDKVWTAHRSIVILQEMLMHILRAKDTGIADLYVIWGFSRLNGIKSPCLLPISRSKVHSLNMHSIDEYGDERTPLLSSEYPIAESNGSKSTCRRREPASSVAVTMAIALYGTLWNYEGFE